MSTCYFCKGNVVRARIDYMAQSKGDYVLIRNLPVEQCTQCGEVFLDVPASRQIDAALADAAGADERVEIPVVNIR